MKNKLSVIAAAAAVIMLTLCGCFAVLFSHGEEDSPPAVTQQPADVTTQPGSSVTFEAKAEGEWLAYQWYYKKADSPRWSVWKGHDTPKTSATANDSWSGMRVYCSITDSRGHSVATRSARITLGHSVTITSHPRSVTVNPGQTAYFRVEAKGKGLKYQWYYRKSSSRFWIRWKGHTSPEVSAVANVSWRQMHVFCFVTDKYGNTASSGAASVRVEDVPTVITQPQSAEASAGGTLVYRTQGGTEGLVCQWFCVPDGMTYGVKILSGTDQEFTLPAGQWRGGQVYCRLKSPGGKMTFTRRVPVTAAQKPRVTCRSGSEQGTGESISFELVSDGNEAAYQWYIRFRGAIGLTKLPGCTGRKLSLTPSPFLGGAAVFCGVTYKDTSGKTVLSEPAEIPSCGSIVITSQPKDAVVSSGRAVSFSVRAEGTGLKYQWYVRKPDGFAPVRLSGQTERVFTGVPDSSWHNMQVFCRISGEGLSPVDSRSAEVTVNDRLRLKSSPQNVKAKSGETARFTVEAMGRGLQYQWMRRASGSDKWRKWDGMTAPSLSLPADTDWHKMSVRCDVSDCTGKLISSKSAGVWITDALDILRQPRGITVQANRPAEFSIAAQGKGLRFQWYYKKRGMKRWHVWKKHTASVTSAISNPTWDGMRVMCVVTDSSGKKMRSRAVSVRIAE